MRAAIVLSVLLVSAPARALVWPDVEEHVERDLQAADATTRRDAARELTALGPGRGAALAVQALGDPDDEVKLAAADAAIRLHAPGATDAVAAWLNAQDPRLRRKACEVARALPGPRVVAPLGRTLGDPDPQVRASAAEALGQQASPDAVPPLLGRLDDPAPAVRIQIALALARLGDPRAVVPLVGKVQDSSPDVRQAVARALGDLGDARASPALVLALRDQSDGVRREAIAALGRMKAADAVDAIVPFTTDRATALRLGALAALGSIATPDAVRALVQALGTGDDSTGSLDATPVREALVATGDAAIAPLRALLAAPPAPAAAASSAWVLGTLHATGEASDLVAAMRRGALQPAAALHALADAGTPAQVPVVLEFVDDPSPVVRDEAVGAAAVLLDPTHPDGRAVEPLAAALRDARLSLGERVRIVALLGRTGASRAAPMLVELARATDPALRLAAIDALGTLGPAEGTGAGDVLLDALASSDAEVRLRAAMALGRVGGAKARDVLLGRIDGGDEVDRAATLTALGGLLARAPTDAAVRRLMAALELSAGAERDAIIEALGRAPLGSAVKALVAVAGGQEPDDRRAAAVSLASHGQDGAAASAARALLGDPDATVRAEAAWTLGSIGGPGDVPRLATVAGSSDADAAADATAAIARIAAGAHAPDVARAALCPLVVSRHPYVRANALAGLALAGTHCGDGSSERRALDGCARDDPSRFVAPRCRARTEAATTHALLVYVVADGATGPHPGSPYCMLLADGLLRAGTTDRRGAVFDPRAPEGDVALRRPIPSLP